MDDDSNDDVFDYSNQTEDELKNMIVRNVEQINGLKDDKKEYSKGINKTIKHLDKRNKAAIEELEARKSA